MKKKKTTTNKFRLALIKSNCIKLRGNYQLPIYLTKLILDLKIDDSVKYVAALMLLSESYLRLRGYYKKYPEADTQATKDVTQYLVLNGFLK